MREPGEILRELPGIILILVLALPFLAYNAARAGARTGRKGRLIIWLINIFFAIFVLWLLLKGYPANPLP